MIETSTNTYKRVNHNNIYVYSITMEQAITVHIPSNELEEEDDSKSSSRDIDRGEELWREMIQ